MAHEGIYKKAAFAFVVAAGVSFVLWQARWYVFQTRISDALIGLPKCPDVARLAGLRERIGKEARSLWIPPETVSLDIHLEQHGSNGFAAKEDMTEYFWFVVVHARRGQDKADQEQRIDTKLGEADLKALEERGVGVVRRSREGGS